MPTYNYECEKCGNVQEEFHGMMESPKIKCTKCKSTKTKKAVCAPAGWMKDSPVNNDYIKKMSRKY